MHKQFLNNNSHSSENISDEDFEIYKEKCIYEFKQKYYEKWLRAIEKYKTNYYVWDTYNQGRKRGKGAHGRYLDRHKIERMMTVIEREKIDKQVSQKV